MIAEKNKVHEEFPIPLLNRLEKHYMSSTTLLDHEEEKAKCELEKWMVKFVTPDTKKRYFLTNIMSLPHSKTWDAWLKT